MLLDSFSFFNDIALHSAVFSICVLLLSKAMDDVYVSKFGCTPLQTCLHVYGWPP
jgi:hypothetical protein